MRKPPGTPEPVVIDPNAPPPMLVGDRVSHADFGAGSVMRVDGDKLTLAFDKGGSRKVLRSFVERL